MQVINTNVMSLNAQRNLQTNSMSLGTSIQRLSSGLRINSAKDDAAGLAISERFTTQIRGLNQATRNANDGISLAQVGEGSLAEISSNLQRIRELAVQSANATNSSSDRAALNLEVHQRLSEIDRIASQTSFNGRKILDGSFGNASFQIGANVGETIVVELDASMRTSVIGAVATATTVDMSTLITPGTAGLVLATGDLTIGGNPVAAGTYTDINVLATAVNTAAGSAIAVVNGNVLDFTNTTGSAIAIAGANNPLGVTSVPAAVTTPTVDNSITAADFNTFQVTDLSITVAGGGTVAISNGNYTSATLAAAINAAADVSLAGTTADGFNAANNAGALDVTGGATNAVTFSGADASIFSNAVVATTTTETAAAGNFDQFEVTALTVDGNPVANGSYDAAGLIAAINTAFGSAIAATDGAGGINVTNSTNAAIVFAGANAATLGIGSVAAAGTVNGTASSIDLSTLLAPAPAASLTLADGDLNFEIDGTTYAVAAGTYATTDSLVAAMNIALAGNAFVALDATTNVISVSTGKDIAITSANAGAGVFTAALFAASGSLDNVNVLTVEGANEAMQRVDAALEAVSTLRSTFGAIQNRFETVIANLRTTSENLTASRSRIRDADFAAETAELTRNQILQQAGIAMLAQANAAPESVLSLLR